MQKETELLSQQIHYLQEQVRKAEFKLNYKRDFLSFAQKAYGKRHPANIEKYQRSYFISSHFIFCRLGSELELLKH